MSLLGKLICDTLLGDSPRRGRTRMSVISDEFETEGGPENGKSDAVEGRTSPSI